MKHRRLTSQHMAVAVVQLVLQ